jgi:uncharacterized protein (DUF697 family)
VLLKRPSVDEVVRAIESRESRQFAYEMAVGVCDADGAHNDAEREFLDRLGTALAMDTTATRAYQGESAALVSVPVEEAGALQPVASTPVNEAELDKMIRNYSILNGALELLPQSLASMAIIPLQIKMVYRIGRVHGYELDRGHIKDLLAAMGVGLTTQYVEEIGRKLIGGLLGRIGGKLAGGIGRQATGSARAFATTYALSQVAKACYGGGRVLSVDKLKASYRSLVREAQALRARTAGEIEQKARTIDTQDLLALVKQQ